MMGHEQKDVIALQKRIERYKDKHPDTVLFEKDTFEVAVSVEL